MALRRKPIDGSVGWTNWTPILPTCLFLCLAGIGCVKSHRGPGAERPVKGHDTPEEVHTAPRNGAFTEGAADTNALRGLVPAVVDGHMALRPIASIDRTKDGCPPELLSKAAKMLQDNVIAVWDVQNDWSSHRLYLVVTYLGEESLFMDRDGHYIRLDSGSELIAINEVLQGYRFGREHVNDPQRVFQFLGEITFLHEGPGLVPGSSFALKTMGRLSDWLRGTAQNQADLLELCEDPDFVFEGNTWTVVFNAIKRNGGVDRWRVVGEHDPEADRNEILRIDVCNILPKGTFSYPMIP